MLKQPKCQRCRDDGFYYVVKQGNPFLMGAVLAAANSIRVECDHRIDYGIHAPKVSTETVR